MNIRTMVALANKAKEVIEERGGTERLRQDAERLRDIASGPGTPQEKAKAAGDALKAKDAPAPDVAEGSVVEEVPAVAVPDEAAPPAREASAPEEDEPPAPPAS